MSLRLMLFPKLKAFRHDRRGATAVETAFVVGPFFLIVAGIMEVGMIALGSSAMENAVRDVGRSTRVDTTQCLTPAQFKTRVCSAVAFLPNCTQALEVQRRTFANFGSGGQNWNNNNPTQWDASQGGDITVYQARYVWKNMFPMLDSLLGTPQANGGNGVMISQSYAYKNEAWGSRDCGNTGGGTVLMGGNGVASPGGLVNPDQGANNNNGTIGSSSSSGGSTPTSGMMGGGGTGNNSGVPPTQGGPTGGGGSTSQHRCVVSSSGNCYAGQGGP